MVKARARRHFIITMALSSTVLASPAFGQQVREEATENAAQAMPGDIVVTARKRDETLTSVPVAVSAVGSAAIARTNAVDLSKLAELTPGVVIGAYRVQGGGSIGIRGISSPANVAGFEQAVSVALDGVQTSNGRIAQIGVFDVQQIEVLKGPQALFFGRNSPAGVISVKTAGPTDTLQVTGGAGYEFVGDEFVGDAAISGPLTDNLGFRVAVRYRDLTGWLYNDARPIANPFYNPATEPPGGAILPGAANRRYGNNEFLGRLTLDYRFAPDWSATLKIFGSRYRDSGPGQAAQNIGPCNGPTPRMYGVADPYGDCKPDNHMSNGAIPVSIAQGLPNSSGTGEGFSRLDFVSGSFNLSGEVGPLNLTMLTGYNWANSHADYGLDQTVYSQLFSTEIDRIREFSQEIRVMSDFGGAFNFVAGGYYQRTTRAYLADTMFNMLNYDPVAGRYDSSENFTKQKGETFSAFGQVILKLSPTLELAGGARYTHERKTMDERVRYGQGAFAVQNVILPAQTQPGTLAGSRSENNVSPEATLTWRPDTDHTLYVAYKTGFKSGGFTVANPTATTLISDIAFGPERVKGFELGAKGRLFDRRLTISAALFGYTYRNLQVNAFDPVRVQFLVGNAGKVRQRGLEIEGSFQVTPELNLHAAGSYVHNRFKDYTGPCYAYTFAPGTSRAAASPPPNCSFLNTSALTLQQVQDGRAPARSPDLSGNAGFVFEIPTEKFKYGITGDGFYSGSYYASDTKSFATKQGAFFRFNASISISQPDDRWALSLLGRNLTNKYYLLFAADRTGGTTVPGYGEQRGIVARGREIMLQARLKY